MKSKTDNIILQKIIINNFRVFNFITIEFSSPITIIAGANGTGKTTILKAIEYLLDHRKFRLEDSYNFYQKDTKIPPSFEYHLNPSFFGLESKSNSIILSFHPEKKGFEIMNKTDFIELKNTRELLKQIKDKKGIVSWDKELLYKNSQPSQLSMGELLGQEFKKFAEYNYENQIILIDEATMLLDFSRKIEFKKLLKHLAEKNQVILTSVNIQQEKSKDYDIKVLSRGQLLTQYLVEIIRGNSKFYITFIESIENVEKLIEISITDSDLWNTQTKMLYLNVIIAMETYLSDAFINTVVNNKNLIRKLLKTSSEFEKRKFKVSELISWLENMKQSAEEHLLNIVYHNIWKVKNMYKDVLGVDFPDDLEDIQKAIMRRHDIVHRNGKTKDGMEIKIGKEDIKDLIEIVKDFIKYIDDQLAV